METIFYTEFVDMCMVCFRTEFYMPGYGDFFVIAIEPKVNHILIRYFVVLAYSKVHTLRVSAYLDCGFSVLFPQGKTRKDGARPALFLIFVLFYVFFVLFYVFLCCSMYFCVVLFCVLCRFLYCLCVYVY